MQNKITSNVRMCADSSLLDHDFSFRNCLIDETRILLVWKIKKVINSIETMRSIMKSQHDCSEWFHRIVTDSKQLKHHINLFHGYVINIIHVKYWYGDHYNDRKNKKRHIIQCWVKIVQIMVMILISLFIIQITLKWIDVETTRSQ